LKIVADINSVLSGKNDVFGAYSLGDTVDFVLKKNGVVTDYVPVSIEFPATNNAWYCQISARDVLLSDGTGCYELYMTINYAGIESTVLWGQYRLWQYVWDENESNVEGDCRIMSVFNDNNVQEGIDFTGSNFVQSVRFKGKFGYFQPNTVVDNTQYTTREMIKVRREDLKTYELRTLLIGFAFRDSVKNKVQF